MSRQLQQKYSFHDLTHERRFIPSEPLECSIIEIGEPLETERQVAGRVYDQSARTGRLATLIGFGIARVIVAATFLVVLVLEWKEFGCRNWAGQMLRSALYPIVSAITQDLRLDREQFGLNASSAPQSPQQGRQPKYELTLDRGAGVIVSNDGSSNPL
jgi:hypothetical protein